VLFPFVCDIIGGSHYSAALLMAGLSETGIRSVTLVHREGLLE
jgi:hypothetical protein